MDKKLLAIYCSAFIGPLSGIAVLSLIQTLKNSFNSPVEIILLSIPFFMVTFAFFQLFSGSVSDLTERRKIAVFGFLFYAIGSLVCAVSFNIQIFLLGRIVQGFGFAFVSPVLAAMVGDITTNENRGTAMSYFSASLTFGITLGPLIAGVFSEHWQYVFILFALLSIFASALIWITFSSFSKEKKAKDNRTVLSQLKATSKNRNVIILCVIGFISFFAFIGTISFLSDFLSLERFSMSEKEIGIILSSSGFFGIVASPLAGKSIGKKGRKFTAILGFLIFTFTLVLLFFAVNFLEYCSFFTFFGLISALGFSTSFVWSSLFTISVELIPEKRGTVSSLYNSSRFFGYAISPLVLTPFYIKLGISYIFLICLITVVVGIFLVFMIETKEK